MSNYDDTPSMEEILRRIKTALRDRENKTLSDTVDFSVGNNEVLKTDLNVTTNTQQYKNDSIFIKPNLNTDNEDVFVLSQDMKINSKQKNISNVFHHISILMANDLGMPYLSNKIETWLSENFFYIYKKYKE